MSSPGSVLGHVPDEDRDPNSGEIDESSAYHPTDPGPGPAPDEGGSDSGDDDSK
jgi:hypothetical protein